jgi:protein-disulfide isomerase
MLGVTVGVAVAVVVVAAMAAGGSGSGAKPGSPAARRADAAVASLLTGIPQAGARLGSPSATVIVTEFADLQCTICKDFAEGAEAQLISNDVRSGKVQLIYRAFSTATANSSNPNVFPTQQAAALAAGEQQKAWQYIELFYREQGQEGTDYVNTTFLNDVAHQVRGLDFTTWRSARPRASLVAQVARDEQEAHTKGYTSTPTIVVQGARGQAAPIFGNTDYATLEAKIKSVK